MYKSVSLSSDWVLADAVSRMLSNCQVHGLGLMFASATNLEINCSEVNLSGMRLCVSCSVLQL